MQQDLAAQLRTIAEHAKMLRDAGIGGTVRVGDVEFTLEGGAAIALPTAAEAKPPSALNDHTTYGYAEGSSLPGFIDPRGKASQ